MPRLRTELGKWKPGHQKPGSSGSGQVIVKPGKGTGRGMSSVTTSAQVQNADTAAAQAQQAQQQAQQAAYQQGAQDAGGGDDDGDDGQSPYDDSFAPGGDTPWFDTDTPWGGDDVIDDSMSGLSPARMAGIGADATAAAAAPSQDMMTLLLYGAAIYFGWKWLKRGI